MISTNLAGGLGNYMFQISVAHSLALDNNDESIFNIETTKIAHKKIESYLSNIFRNVNFGKIKSDFFYNEPNFTYEKIPYIENILLNGYYQSEKYFKHISDVIHKDFTFREEHLEPCKEFMSEFEGQEPIMLHVRRGDPNLVDPRGFKWAYVNCSDQHPVQPLEYYEKALNKFDDNQPVIVFSDSPEWVKEQEFFSDERFMISEPLEKYGDGSYLPYVDLCLMSLCSHAIIANSSMSWWGAWLQTNPNKKIVAPRMWFGSSYSDKNTKDLYCSDWIVI